MLAGELARTPRDQQRVAEAAACVTWEYVVALTGIGDCLTNDRNCCVAQRDGVRLGVLHAAAGQAPDARGQVKLRLSHASNLARTLSKQKTKPNDPHVRDRAREYQRQRVP